MSPRPLLFAWRATPGLALVPALAVMTASMAQAADAPGPSIVGAGGGATEITPGKLQGGGRQVYIQGVVDLDAIQQGNYKDGNSNNPALSDHRSEGWYRAEIGTRIAVDSRIEVQVTVAGQGVMGDSRATDDGLAYNNPSTSNNGPTNGMSGNAVIDDAFIKLKDFLNYRELSIDAGRQPAAWNLRRDHGAFLYDSRADYHTVTSWDGLRASYNFDTLDLTPYVFRMQDNSQLYGVSLDWKPAQAGDDRLFLTGSANLERRTVLNNSIVSDKLITYYIGIDADFKDFELYGEFAMQNGDQDDNTKFKGFGLSLGLDWHVDQLVFGLQFDHMTGDDNPTDGKNTAFINNWEAVSDTYIVESEKYGELSRLLQGNLQALKGKIEFALDSAKRVRLKTVYAYYKTEKSSVSGSNKFGQEADLSLAWDFTPDSTITLLGGLFKPDGVYKDVSPAGVNAGDDYIYLFGANLQVKF